ncbi:MAG: PilN domain-containing protein [Patescibacteria group bacterium]
MPAKNQKFIVRLDLLKPQSNPEKLPVKFLRWLLSSGRFIFIFVEALVLLAFITRFKLDADLANKKEVIEQEIPFIESLKSYEILIRQTQLKLSTIASFRADSANYPQILKNIADQTPLGIKIISINLKKDVSKIIISINAQAQSNNDLSNFITGLKELGLGGVTLASVSLEQGLIRFTVNADATIQIIGEKRL